MPAWSEPNIVSRRGSAGMNATTIPTNNVATEGTVTHGSGVCNTTLGAITPAVSSMPVIRLYQ